MWAVENVVVLFGLTVLGRAVAATAGILKATTIATTPTERHLPRLWMTP